VESCWKVVFCDWARWGPQAASLRLLCTCRFSEIPARDGAPREPRAPGARGFRRTSASLARPFGVAPARARRHANETNRMHWFLFGLQVGVFQMGEAGLAAVPNPSQMFLADRSRAPGVGSSVTVAVEGTRPLLLEVQALCSPSHQARAAASGFV
jgi:hypothetical protein